MKSKLTDSPILPCFFRVTWSYRAVRIFLDSPYGTFHCRMTNVGCPIIPMCPISPMMSPRYLTTTPAMCRPRRTAVSALPSSCTSGSTRSSTRSSSPASARRRGRDSQDSTSRSGPIWPSSVMEPRRRPSGTWSADTAGLFPRDVPIRRFKLFVSVTCSPQMRGWIVVCDSILLIPDPDGWLSNQRRRRL